MSSWAVSLVFTQELNHGEFNIHNSLRVVFDVDSKETAFDMAFKDCFEILKTHKFEFYTAVQICK